MGCRREARVPRDLKDCPPPCQIKNGSPLKSQGWKNPRRERLLLRIKKQKPHGSLTRDEMVEGLKRSPKKGEKLEREYSSRSLQEALEEIRKKAALDKIRDRVASRQELEKRSTTGSSQGTSVSSSESSTGSGSRVGTGVGSGQEQDRRLTGRLTVGVTLRRFFCSAVQAR